MGICIKFYLLSIIHGRTVILLEVQFEGLVLDLYITAIKLGGADSLATKKGRALPNGRFT